jgi:hypothetical protein
MTRKHAIAAAPHSGLGQNVACAQPEMRRLLHQKFMLLMS